MRLLRPLAGERLVVEVARRGGIEREVELVPPVELEPRLGERVVARLRPRMSLGQIGGARGDLVGDDSVLDVVAVGQAEMFLAYEAGAGTLAEVNAAATKTHERSRSGVGGVVYIEVTDSDDSPVPVRRQPAGVPDTAWHPVLLRRR